jgi:hypothetical protein
MSATAEEAGEWQVARGRRPARAPPAGAGARAAAASRAAPTRAPAARRSRASHPAPAGPPPPPAADAPLPSAERVARAAARVAAAAAELAAAPFFAGLKSALAAAGLLGNDDRAPRALVVLGLGSLEAPGAVVRHQAALALLLASALAGSLASRPEAFDPVATPLDRAVLEHLGVAALTLDEGGRRVARAKTLFWMPHCDAELTDALVEANLEAGTLENVAVLGNSFEAVAERWAAGGAAPAGRRRPGALLAARAAGRVAERRVREAGAPTGAFNDLALHTFGGGDSGDGSEG